MTWTPEAHISRAYERGRSAWVKQQIPLLAQEFEGNHDGLMAALGSMDDRWRAWLAAQTQAHEEERRRRYRAALDAAQAAVTEDSGSRL